MKVSCLSALILFSSTFFIYSCKKEKIGRLPGTSGCLDLPYSAKVNERIAIYSCVDLNSSFFVRFRNLDQNADMFNITLASAQDTFYYESSTPFVLGLEVTIKPIARNPRPGMVIYEAKDTVIIFE